MPSAVSIRRTRIASAAWADLPRRVRGRRARHGGRLGLDAAQYPDARPATKCWTARVGALPGAFLLLCQIPRQVGRGVYRGPAARGGAGLQISRQPQTRVEIPQCQRLKQREQQRRPAGRSMGPPSRSSFCGPPPDPAALARRCCCPSVLADAPRTPSGPTSGFAGFPRSCVGPCAGRLAGVRFRFAGPGRRSVHATPDRPGGTRPGRRPRPAGRRCRGTTPRCARSKPRAPALQFWPGAGRFQEVAANVRPAKRQDDSTLLHLRQRLVGRMAIHHQNAFGQRPQMFLRYVVAAAAGQYRTPPRRPRGRPTKTSDSPPCLPRWRRQANASHRRATAFARASVPPRRRTRVAKAAAAAASRR
jgi:hypothetical protein